MKRKTLLFTIAVLLSGVFIQSCDKIKDKLFDSFSAKGVDATFEVSAPLLPTPVMLDLGTYTSYFNLDSVVRDFTKNAFSISDISSVKADSLTLMVLNPTADHNLSNFAKGEISISSSSNPTPVKFEFEVPDQYAETLTIAVGNNTELKPYLTGNTFTYNIKAQLRKAVTQDMEVRTIMKFKIDN